jgi:hypothetical protein
MAKEILTRIGLKIDTLAAWNESTIPLLAGELAIATVAAGAGTGLTEPVIMIKIGEDGKKTFKELDWALHAKASDVYGWAKKSETEFLTWIEEQRPTVVDTDLDTRYSFELVDGALVVKKTLYTLGVAGAEETVGTYDFVTPAELATALNSYYTKDEVDALIADAKKYADDNDANTTYTLGYESKVDGEGGHPARIVLTPSEGEATYVDATPFIKDGMLDNVAYDADTNTLTFTFNTDAGKEAVTVELTDILAPYSGHVGDTVTVLVDGNTIKAELNTEVVNDIATAKADAAQAKTDAAAAVSTANTANTTAGEAKELAQGAVTTANEAKTAATEAQNSAAASAEVAAGHAADALASKTAAAQSAADATAAKTAAETAKGAAETAQGLAKDAKDAAVVAQGAAEGAKDAAVAAQGAAETAKAGAEDAKAAAVTAQGKAEDAQAAAETAQGLAETAKANAETARDAAVTAKAGAETAKTDAETAKGLAVAA